MLQSVSLYGYFFLSLGLLKTFSNEIVSHYNSVSAFKVSFGQPGCKVITRSSGSRWRGNLALLEIE